MSQTLTRKCNNDKGTLFHCLWTCPRIKEFWEEVRKELQWILLINIELDPKLFLLGLYPVGQKIKNCEITFLDLGFLQAKRVIALSWKRTRKPSIAQWFKYSTAQQAKQSTAQHNWQSKAQPNRQSKTQHSTGGKAQHSTAQPNWQSKAKHSTAQLAKQSKAQHSPNCKAKISTVQHS